MILFKFSPRKPSVAIVLAAVLAIGTAWWALAQTVPNAPKPTERNHPAGVPASGLTVAIDPLTKQIRPVTPEEAQALRGARSPASALSSPVPSPQPTVVQHVGGMKSVVLPESYMETLTATKQADGRLSFQCASENEKPRGISPPPPAETRKTISNNAVVPQARNNVTPRVPQSPVSTPKLEEK